MVCRHSTMRREAGGWCRGRRVHNTRATHLCRGALTMTTHEFRLRTPQGPSLSLTFLFLHIVTEPCPTAASLKLTHTLRTISHCPSNFGCSLAFANFTIFEFNCVAKFYFALCNPARAPAEPPTCSVGVGWSARVRVFLVQRGEGGNAAQNRPQGRANSSHVEHIDSLRPPSATPCRPPPPPPPPPPAPCCCSLESPAPCSLS